MCYHTGLGVAKVLMYNSCYTTTGHDSLFSSSFLQSLKDGWILIFLCFFLHIYLWVPKYLRMTLCSLQGQRVSCFTHYKIKDSTIISLRPLFYLEQINENKSNLNQATNNIVIILVTNIPPWYHTWLQVTTTYEAICCDLNSHHKTFVSKVEKSWLKALCHHFVSKVDRRK